MTGGATRGSGGSQLGAHLADAKALNEATWPGSASGLVSEGIVERIAELTDIASHARSRTPLYHVHADPDCEWSDDRWRRYWELVEIEFGLVGQPYAEVIHVKAGREHRHRVYLRLTAAGTCIRIDNDYARREKLHRLIELEFGTALTPGRHNRAVIAALEAEGRLDAAAALRAAGLDSIDRPAARTTPRERAQAERTGVDPHAVGVAVLTAWRASDTGAAFLAALADQGLRVAQGDKVPVIVDTGAGTHPLSRLLAKAAKSEGSAAIRAADVAARLGTIALDRHVPGCTEAARSSSEPATDDPNRVGQIVGAGLPHPLQISPAPTGGATTDAGIIAAVDPTKPGDAARFLRETSAAQARRMSAIVSARFRNHTGDVHVRYQQQPIHRHHPVQEFGVPAVGHHRRAGPEAQAVVDRGPAGRPTGDVGSAAGPGGRSEGIVDGHVRRDVGRGDVGSPAALARPAGASGGWRDIEDRRRDRPAGADRRQPGEDRREAGRDRVDAYQIDIGLAARPDALARLRALTRVLSAPIAGPEADQPVSPPDRSAVLEDALAMSDARTAKVLAEQPWPNPRDRDAQALSLVAQKTIEDAVRDAQGRALAARDRRDDAERRLGMMDRLIGKMGIGRQTEAVLAIRTMAAEAEQLRMAADTLSYFQRDRLDRAAVRAADLARERQAERKRWAESSTVVRAMRERHGNDLVWRAIYAGDVDVQDLAERDLRAARELLLRLEQVGHDTTHVSAVELVPDALADHLALKLREAERS